LDLLLKLSTNMSPALTEPTVWVTGQIAYGLTSPLAGVVELINVTVVLPAKKDPGSGVSSVAASRSSIEYWEFAYAPACSPLKPSGTLEVFEPHPAAPTSTTSNTATSATAPPNRFWD